MPILTNKVYLLKEDDATSNYHPHSHIFLFADEVSNAVILLIVNKNKNKRCTKKE